MTTGTLTPDDGENEAVKSAEDIVLREAESANLEATFVFAMKVGLWLKKWRAEMLKSEEGEDAFTKEWTEDAAMTLFHKFFTPFYPPFPTMDDDDD